ncbi:9709_t:CDS:2, partial [Dentiscutata erythropus]
YELALGPSGSWAGINTGFGHQFWTSLSKIHLFLPTVASNQLQNFDDEHFEHFGKPIV